MRHRSDRPAGGSARLGGRARVAAALAATTVAALPAFLTGALGVELRDDLHVGAAQLGAAVSAYFAVSALSSAVLGHLGQRLGVALAIRIGGTISAASMLAVALAAQSFASLAPLLAIGGIGNALSQPAVNAFLSRTIPDARLGLAFGIKQSAIPTAVLLSGLSVPALALTVGWRVVFVAAAAVAVAIAMLVGRVAGPAAPRGRAPGRPHTSRRLLSVLAVAAGLAATGGNALGTFLVSAAVASGIAQGGAGLLLAAGSLTCVAVRVVAGSLADRHRSEGLGAVIVLLLCGALGFAALASGNVALLIAGTFLAFAGGWGWAGLFNFAVVTRNRDAPGVATGITQTGVYVGAAGGPLLFGAIAASSYTAAFLAMAALILIGAAITTAAKRVIDR